MIRSMGEAGTGDIVQAVRHMRAITSAMRAISQADEAELFGWAKDITMDMGALGVYQLFRTGGAEAAGGIMTRMPGMPQSFWLYYVNVDAIDAAVARITGAGGQVINGPMEVPGGNWIVNAVDPQGAAFALVAPRR